MLKEKTFSDTSGLFSCIVLIETRSNETVWVLILTQYHMGL